ncbi:MAG: thiamine pyrophosphate-binding protein [Betaproteobacteria bacterium]|nr:MAG: thiamine pyrophosphate-binding protein [Betaproteobacteria bacterium]
MKTEQDKSAAGKTGALRLPETTKARAEWLAKAGGLETAIGAGYLGEVVTMPLAEALVLGLMRQGVSKYLVIFGHGSTALGEALRAYETAGLIKGFQFRNEVEMSHAATALRWVYDEPCAVVTSIGPGALQAMAGSLAAASNGVGVYHIYGDETTHGEGYNMQQVPKPEQGLFGRITGAMGGAYTLHAPGSVRDALRKGAATVFHPWKAGPFYFNLPLNTQPANVSLRLDALPQRPEFPRLVPADSDIIDQVARLVAASSKVAIKAGGGARRAAKELTRFAEASGAAVVLSPGSTGVLPDAHPQNMHVGGSKGSISGNFAMDQAELLVVVGSRAVCQSDCSGIGWPKVHHVININADPVDVQHYNNTLALTGDATHVLEALAEKLQSLDAVSVSADWLRDCAAKKADWVAFKEEHFNAPPLHDDVWQRPVLTQPQAIKITDEFCRKHNAIKFFDAGDVQANGFQIVEDERPGETYTESGASYMGFAVSALLAGGLAERGRYAVAFTGDGSFMMNPQVLIDGIEHGVHATIVLFDNRRMAAISQLQLAQYGRDYRTNDAVPVDYVQMANAVTGVKALWGGDDAAALRKALEEAHTHPGLSLVHVPVYHGSDPLGGMGAYGSWNVGNWCTAVQQKYAATLI